MIYYDSSALLKLVQTERESDDFRRWYDQHRGTDAASSALVRVEVIRAARQHDEATEQKARVVLAGLDLLPVSLGLLDAAAGLPYAVRSLDAIHLASALEIGAGLEAFVAYDERLLMAAEQAGLPVASPGLSAA